MPTSDAVRLAAKNNAEWCDTFCRTHGIVGTFSADAWLSPTRTPPYYPDAVTLDTGVEIEGILDLIDTNVGCSVKDSFAQLDLAPRGFEVLFRGEWLVCEADEPSAERIRGWTVVSTERQLREWQRAWGDAPHPDFFRDALLQCSDVVVLAGQADDRIAAGAIANRTGAVVGLTNVFDADGDLESAWRESRAAVGKVWSDARVVGYDTGPSLDAARAAGFRTIGELIVWFM